MRCLDSGRPLIVAPHTGRGRSRFGSMTPEPAIHNILADNSLGIVLPPGQSNRPSAGRSMGSKAVDSGALRRGCPTPGMRWLEVGPIWCPRCGSPVAQGARFCSVCTLPFVPMAPARPRSRVGLTVGIVALILVAAIVAIGAMVGPSSSNTRPPAATDSYPNVVYMVSGSANAASITFNSSSGNIEQDTDVAIPLTSDGTPGLLIRPQHGAFVR